MLPPLAPIVRSATGISAAALLALPAVAAADLTFALVQASSPLTLGGDAGGFPVTQQSPGSLTTRYSGPIVLTSPPYATSFGVVSANAAAAIGGTYQPGIGGAAGSAPANYGGLVNLGVFGNALLAGRNLRVGLSAGSVPLSGGGPSGGGSFPVSGLTATILEGAADYTFVLTGPGSNSLVGLTASAGTGTGTLAISGSAATLTIPINATFMTTLAGLPATITVTGTLVSTATLPPACPADFNGEGGLSVQDIFDFLAAYFANDPLANFNGVGGITVQDIFDFLAAYFAGCP